MEQDWIKDRRRLFQQKVREESTARYDAEEARNGFTKMFERIMNVVEKDVKDYNKEFADESRCHALFEKLSPMCFDVKTEQGTVSVNHAGAETTVINVLWHKGIEGLKISKLEVVHRGDGDLKYKHEEKIYDAREFSKLILEPILC